MFIPKITINAHTIGRQFTDYRIVFFYDLSHDGTLNLIHDAQRESQNKIDILCNSHPQGKVPKTHHLAHARNSMIEHIRKNYSDFEYFAMMDSDEVCTHPPNIELFQRCMKRKDWGDDECTSHDFNNPLLDTNIHSFSITYTMRDIYIRIVTYLTSASLQTLDRQEIISLDKYISLLHRCNEHTYEMPGARSPAMPHQEPNENSSLLLRSVYSFSINTQE